MVLYLATFYLQLCSMVRDMSMGVRLEAFDALQKIEMVSEEILLLTLSKKVNKHIEVAAPSAVGAFVHGLEDEYYEVLLLALLFLFFLIVYNLVLLVAWSCFHRLLMRYSWLIIC